MIKIFPILLLISIALAAKIDDDDWQTYTKKFHPQKVFDDEEKAYKNYKKNKLVIDQHNSDESRTYDQKENEYSIYDEEEFTALFCGTKAPESTLSVGGRLPGGGKTTKTTTTKAPTTTTTAAPTTTTTTTAAPAQNWPGPLGSYTRDTVPLALNFTDQYPPIKNQGQCGSCWAFAATAAIGNYVRNTGTSTNWRGVSESFFVDCDIGESGCNGGWPASAVTWARDYNLNQAPDDVDYPYTGPFDGSVRSTCKSITSNLIQMGIRKSVNPPRVTNILDIPVMIANNGHVILALYVSNNFQNYGSGIFTDSQCFSGNCNYVNHAVVAVGYDIPNKFLIIRNSWGTGWGEKGYMKLPLDAFICNYDCYPSMVN